MKIKYVFGSFYVTEEGGTIMRLEKRPYLWEYRTKDGKIIDKDGYRIDLFERNNLIEKEI